jgi:ABC-type Fe3+-siderophore transport system permease subunit
MNSVTNSAAPVPSRLFGAGPAILASGLIVLAGLLTWQGLAARLPAADWLDAMLRPDLADMREVLVHYSWLPRLLTAWLCGAALGLSGAILQQVLRNPLASPTTLGVSAGAQLALTLAALLAPGLLAVAREWIAVAGAAGVLGLVFALAWNKALSPLSMVLGGMVLSLYCGALTALLIIFSQNYLVGLLIWGAGSLSQQDWSAVTYLGPRVIGGAVLAAFLVRPLSVVGLGDDGARSLGVSLTATRFAAMSLAVLLAAMVVSAVGVIGFIGLAAPPLAMLAGARRFGQRLLWAPIIGAALLWLADQFVQMAAGVYGDLAPTGALTALFGSPLLLWLLPRLRVNAEPPSAAPVVAARAARPGRLLLMLAAVLAAAVVLALVAGRGLEGWSAADAGALLPWRWPRTLGALAAGAMLAASGVLLQRLTGNAMASPEVFGISAGAALGLIVLIFAVPGPDRIMQIGAGSIGAFLALAGVLALARRSGFAPDRLLLAGIALSALFDALVVALTATGDPRAVTVLAWLTGSTYRVTGPDALTTLAVGLVLGALLSLTARWADMLPLGGPTAQALGMHVRRARLAILILTAGLSATATLVVGPLTFVGLIAPHLARMLGFQRALPQLAGAALIGALIMVSADWLGRTLLFPRQVPAGLVAALIGAPYFMWRMRRP